jgi:radical SAM superfamily enzyme YgiQ (UPF0313 family)
MTDLLLVFPPSVLAETLPVSLAALTAYVRREGFTTVQDDWNARFNGFCLNHTSLDVVTGNDDISEHDRLFIKNYFLHYVAGSYFSDLCTDKWLSAPGRANGEDSIWSPPYPFSYMQFLEAFRDDPDQAEAFIRDPDRNIFHAFFEQEILPRCGNPAVVGFSMVSYAQAIPAMTLAFLLRRHLKDVHICWGGPWVTSFCHIFAPALAKTRSLATLVDSFVVREGEEPLLQLVRAVRQGAKAESIPNTWLPSPGYATWIAPSTEWMADMKALPAPDYSGFLTELYTSYQEGRGSIVVQGSRSCYHMKCTFCNAITNLAPKYRERPVDMIREDILRAFADVPSAKVVDFADAVFPARRLRNIAEFFLQLGRDDLEWAIDVRFERNISKDLLELIQRSGGLLRFGLETASERLLELVKKGNRMEVVRRILSDSRELGYKPFLMTIVGLPSETVEDVHALVDFLAEYSDTSTFQIADFMVEYGSPIHRSPQEYGIEIASGDADKLSHHIPFRRLSGYGNETAQHAFLAALSEVLQRINGAGRAVVTDSGIAKTVKLTFASGKINVPPVRFRYNGRPFGGVVAIGYMMQQAVTPMSGAGVLIEEGCAYPDYGESRQRLGFDPSTNIANTLHAPARAAAPMRCAAG